MNERRAVGVERVVSSLQFYNSFTILIFVKWVKFLLIFGFPKMLDEKVPTTSVCLIFYLIFSSFRASTQTSRYNYKEICSKFMNYGQFLTRKLKKGTKTLNRQLLSVDVNETCLNAHAPTYRYTRKHIHPYIYSEELYIFRKIPTKRDVWF